MPTFLIVLAVISAFFLLVMYTAARHKRSFQLFMKDRRGMAGYDAVGLKCKAYINCSNGTAAALASTGEGWILARTGAGTYTLTLDSELGGSPLGAIGDAIPFVTNLGGAADSSASAVITSTTVITVTTFVAGVATDSAFSAILFEAAVSGT